MKTKTLSSKSKYTTSSKKMNEADTFEEDWKNGISGDEFVKRVHDHIRKLYASKSKK